MFFSKEEIGLVLRSLLMFSGVPFDLHGKAPILGNDEEMIERLDEKFVKARQHLTEAGVDRVAVDLSNDEVSFVLQIVGQILRECVDTPRNLEIHVGDLAAVNNLRNRLHDGALGRWTGN